MLQHGFVRVAAASPRLRVADCAHNVERLLELLDRAERDAVQVVVFPELAVTGYTCGDLFHQSTLQKAALDALDHLLDESERRFSGLFVVGLPWLIGDQLFNVAAACQKGQLLGVVPKSYLPNYKEFYEARWFTPGRGAVGQFVEWQGHRHTPFGVDLLFADEMRPSIVVGVEICEDLWPPIPPSSFQALAGAKILVNLSASNEVIGKAGYRRQLVVNQSGRCIAGYVYASNGVTESTTDVVFGGHCLIAENGGLLAESPRFERNHALVISDIDVDRLQNDRLKTTSFGDSVALLQGRSFRRVPFLLQRSPVKLVRPVEAHPFVPSGQTQLAERCAEIFHVQVAGLAKRLEHIGKPPAVIGVSGGLDSTLALLVACKTADALQLPRANVHAVTMPGFGTSLRTLANAHAIMRYLGVTTRQIDIRTLCLDEMRAIGHQPFGIPLDGMTVETLSAKLINLPADRGDLTFENVQARMRTSILMNSGFVIGTGDLSELALGWCTYNGDQISMYNPNVSIPKTLVKFLVRWAADNEFGGDAQKTLHDIVATEISPELLPPRKDGKTGQATESVIGPYELHDFFLFHFLRYGATPEKILFLAGHASFEKPHAPVEIRRWLQVFIRRFFASQFKRSCLPDGPKVGTISVSPRGDWRMPSDAESAAWLNWANEPRTP